MIYQAVNLWIGDERSVSSCHKDYFENFYCVLSGEKTFTLFPPCDVAFLPKKVYSTAKYYIKDCIIGARTEEDTGNLDTSTVVICGDNHISGDDNSKVLANQITKRYKKSDLGLTNEVL